MYETHNIVPTLASSIICLKVSLVQFQFRMSLVQFQFRQREPPRESRARGDIRRVRAPSSRPSNAFARVRAPRVASRDDEARHQLMPTSIVDFFNVDFYRQKYRALRDIRLRERATTAFATHLALNCIANMPVAARTRKRPTNAATMSTKTPSTRKRARQSQRNAHPRDKTPLVIASRSTRSVDTESHEPESDAESPSEAENVAREDEGHQLGERRQLAAAAIIRATPSASAQRPPSVVVASPIDEDFAQQNEAAMARIAAIAAQSRPAAAPAPVANVEHKKRNAALNAALHAIFNNEDAFTALQRAAPAFTDEDFDAVTPWTVSRAFVAVTRCVLRLVETSAFTPDGALADAARDFQELVGNCGLRAADAPAKSVAALLITIARRAAAAGSVDAHEDVRAAFAALSDLEGAAAADVASVPRWLSRMAVELLSIATENVATLDDEPTDPQITFIAELRQQLKMPPLSRDAIHANYTKKTANATISTLKLRRSGPHAK